ncbi:dimethylarginine dimethylaminohydrolase family protein [Halalkalibacter sp. APA_J-10(15)]|uniref:dimethylarginine dimethylaminohydrolase family protein n=1 Tax=unclassified Halalkalibacter TaxID=2893063 RepID=UPI001FF2E07F|nr:arginine deiminase family protein [Halalkalibacter sp. APA_J-10(15)]MCK0469831.1 arginine deiminase family protein [Halalkalibacter sp. APA_J-10(15)]
MESRIRIRNEYGKLEEVILGTAEELYIPDMHNIETESASPWWKQMLTQYLYPLLKGKRAPKWLTRKFQQELAELKQVLLRHGVHVHHPEAIKPQSKEPPGLGQMFARDPILCVDDRLIAGQLQIEMRHKELRGMEKLIEMFDLEQARIERIAAESGLYLEGGDVIVDLPYVYVGIGKYASNQEGSRWLQAILGDQAEVIPVQLTNDGILHLDCCMTIIGDKRGIIHRESLQQPLPAPLHTYEFIEVDDITRTQMGTNVLVLDPQTIIIQKRHQELQKRLEEWGYTVEPVDFTWHARLDGAFRCATCPIQRQ